MAKISDFCQILGFPGFWPESLSGALSAGFWPESRFWPDPGRLASGRSEPGSELARSWKVQNLPESAGRTCQTCLPGAIYRPLSIATSVENDWGRGGPFWQTRLTLALETARFLKKSANHKNRDLGPSGEVLDPLPSEKSKKVRFFALRFAPISACIDHRQSRFPALFFDFLASGDQNFVRNFRTFLGPSGQLSERSDSHLAGSGQTCRNLPKCAPDSDSGWTRRIPFRQPKSALFRDFRDFADFSRFCRFLRFRAPNMVSKVSEKCDFWTSKISDFGVQNRNFPDFCGHDFQARIYVSMCGLLGGIYLYFFEFFVHKKVEKIYLFGLNHL